MKLFFDQKTHTYTDERGIRVPSVTQIINEWVIVEVGGWSYHVNRFSGEVIPSHVMTEAAAVGTAVHKAAWLILTGAGVDMSALHPSLINPVTAVAGWAREYKPQTVACEMRMASARLWYAGTLDWIGRIQGIKGLCLVDFKTGGHRAAGVQTAAYEQLYRDETGERKTINRFVLEIPKDGGACTLIRQKDRSDFGTFLSMQALYEWAIETKRR